MNDNNFVFKSVSFFCPAYNDAGNLPELIPVVHKFLKENSNEFEIIIIHDGGKDRTGEVADELALKFPNIRVIHHEKNKGYTATLKEGFEIGKYEYVMYTDGDNQYDINEFKPYLYLLNNNDIIAGYAITKAVSPFRKLQSLIHNTLINILFIVYFKDINCAMKVFKKSVLEKIKINSSPRGAFIDAELILKANSLGFKIAQFPVTHYERKTGIASGSKPQVIWETFKDMIKLRLNLI
jgi:glycosyltransferase involved in cell wall biosynthesis